MTLFRVARCLADLESHRPSALSSPARRRIPGAAITGFGDGGVQTFGGSGEDLASGIATSSDDSALFVSAAAAFLMRPTLVDSCSRSTRLRGARNRR